MKSQTRFLLVLLVLVPFVCAISAQTSDAAEYWICPVSSMFNHGSYVTYYAKKCNLNSFVTWDGPSGHLLAAMNCCGMGTTPPPPTDPACEHFSEGQGLKALRSHQPHTYRNDEGYEGAKYSYNNSPHTTVDFGTGNIISHYYVRYYRKNDAAKAKPIYAQIFVMFYQLDDTSTPIIVATGHEIKKPAGDPKFDVKDDEVNKGGGKRCHELTIGDLNCTVMLHHGSDPDD